MHEVIECIQLHTCHYDNDQEDEEDDAQQDQPQLQNRKEQKIVIKMIMRAQTNISIEMLHNCTLWNGSKCIALSKEDVRELCTVYPTINNNQYIN